MTISESLRLYLHALVLRKRHYFGQLEAKELGEVAPKLQRGDIFIDVGSHCGSWSVPLALRNPECEVVAVDASPYYAALLGLYGKLFSIRNLMVHNLALGEIRGAVKIVTHDQSGRRLTGYTHVQRLNETVHLGATVHAQRLDELIPEQKWGDVKFIKCDVEGAELMVYKGADALIRMARPVIYSEVDGEYLQRYGYSLHDLRDYFQGLGYEAHQCDFESGHVRLRPGWPASKGDVLLAPAGHVPAMKWTTS